MRKGTPLTFIIIAVSCAFASCSSPVGSVGGRASSGSSGSSEHDTFWVVPRREVYNVFDYFVRADDLRVFASYRGIVDPIDVKDVEISMITNPDASPEYQNEPILINNGERWFDLNIGKGRKLMIITYQEMKDTYSVEVMDPYGLIPEDDPNNPIGPPPIDIIWD